MVQIPGAMPGPFTYMNAQPRMFYPGQGMPGSQAISPGKRPVQPRMPQPGMLPGMMPSQMMGMTQPGMAQAMEQMQMGRQGGGAKKFGRSFYTPNLAPRLRKKYQERPFG